MQLQSAPDEPGEQIPGGDCHKGKGDTDFEEVGAFYLVAVLPENSDGGNIGRGTDGG